MKLLKVPIGKNGSELAPDVIEKRLKEFYLNENGILPVMDVEEFDGDYEKIKKFLAESDKLISIGGNHSISKELIKIFSKINSNPGVIIFDAHPDALNKDDLLPTIIKNFKKENIIIIGLRNWQKQEYKFLRDNKIRFFDMKKIMEYGIQHVAETVMETARGYGALYISIDIDVIDPAYAPGTGCLEPGGLSSRELLFFLQKLKILQNLKAIDITEINPKKDIDEITSKLGAKIIVELS